MSLISFYKQQIKNHNLETDQQQLKVIAKLDFLKAKLEVSSVSYYINKLFGKKYKLGFYLYSGVGRGKTMLMDIFFNNLNISDNKKYRAHFHSFMKFIHQQMQNLSGVKDPIEYIVKNNFKDYKIICLDEFLVHDIADAMILAKLIEALFSNSIILITTSNLHPNDLYKNGLQRSSFLPAIDLLKSNLEVIKLKGDIDYRSKILVKSSCYFYPQTEYNLNKIKDIFYKLSNQSVNLDNLNLSHIEILDREINIIAIAEYSVWFDFNIICSSPRSQQDYLEIAEIFKVVIISNFSKLDDSKVDVVRRFIYFIDILYDYKVKLIIAADVSITEIYNDKIFEFEFKRATSRLKEMQTEQYLASAHV